MTTLLRIKGFFARITASTDERFEALEKTIADLEKTLEQAIAMMANAPSSRNATFDEITANSLKIVDGAGECQIVLGVTETGGGLQISNPAGEPQATLGATSTGGALSINNPAGKLQASLAVTSTGGGLVIYNAAEEQQIGLAVTETGGVLDVNNTAAPQSRGATFDEITAKTLNIVNDAGKQQAVLTATETGGVLVTYDSAEVPRAGLHASETGGQLNEGMHVGNRKTISYSVGQLYAILPAKRRRC
jgi:hypothetical protein